MPQDAHPTVTVNRTLHYLPLVLDVLEEIESGTSHTGADDLRQGAHQAVQSIVNTLKRIKPPQASERDAPTTTDLQIAASWLLGERPSKLLPPGLFEELAELIQKLVPESSGKISGQNATNP